jgi:MerR family mercuric resistance operon transcriptional regulator
MARSATIRIGDLSRQTGCNVETIRYYERVGLLPRPPRSAARYRLYESGDVRRLSFVRRARELGFTLEEVRALLALAVNDREDTCAEVRRLAGGHLAAVRAKIMDLRALERALSDAVRRCDAGERPGCPLIDTLSAAASPAS